jgi:hypothetical protein
VSSRITALAAQDLLGRVTLCLATARDMTDRAGTGNARDRAELAHTLAWRSLVDAVNALADGQPAELAAAAVNQRGARPPMTPVLQRLADETPRVVVPLNIANDARVFADLSVDEADTLGVRLLQLALAARHDGGET